MSKQEFLDRLKKALYGLPQADIEERLTFYSEMIDDHIEDGCSVAEAVGKIGDIETLVTQIRSEFPYSARSKEPIKQTRQTQVWFVLALILGSPLWLALFVSFFAVILSIFVSLWAIVISFWAILLALIVCPIGMLISAIIVMSMHNPVSGVVIISMAIVCAGLAIFMFYACKGISNGCLYITRLIGRWIKRLFSKKEVA